MSHKSGQLLAQNKIIGRRIGLVVSKQKTNTPRSVNLNSIRSGCQDVLQPLMNCLSHLADPQEAQIERKLGKCPELPYGGIETAQTRLSSNPGI